MDIFIRFLYHKVALVSDVEKAFHQVSIAPEDRDVLRFLWIDDAASPKPRIVVYRFTRAVFGVNCSPFLSNASISHHIQQVHRQPCLCREISVILVGGRLQWKFRYNPGSVSVVLEFARADG